MGGASNPQIDEGTIDSILVVMAPCVRDEEDYLRRKPKWLKDSAGTN